MSSLKKNFGYNLILTFCNYLFPLITYPYVSRVLGVENIGTCNFVDGIVNYFILISSLGLASYGVREIAKCRDNLERRNYVFSNLIVLNIITTIITTISLVCITFLLSSLKPYQEFLYLGVIKVVFNMFLIEWFFQGIQNFKYITIRSVFVRLLYVIFVFIFVNTKEDVIIYYGLTIGMIVINATINWLFSLKFRHFSFQNLQLKIFVLPILTFGYYQLLTSMYTTFNLVFLGFSTNDAEVGYFSTATKLYSIFMGIFTAFTTVMVPKVSELLSLGEKDKLQFLADKTFSLLTVLSLPLIILCLFCAEDIILILSGPGYEGAYTPFRIVIFLLLVIGMEQIVIQQFLMASESKKSIMQVCSVGAVVGVSLNIFITPKFGAVGSAISWSVSEFSVLFTGVYLVKRIMGISFHCKKLFMSVLWSLFYIVPLLFLSSLHLGEFQNLFLSCVVVLFVFFIINLKLNKNDIVADMVNKNLLKLHRK